MAGSVNKVILIGNLGRDPEIRSMGSGDRVCNLSVATSEQWRDRQTGDKREKTEWHRVVVFNKGLVDVCEKYLKKGAKIYLAGQIQTRKWQDQSGQDRYTTEIVLQNYRGELTMLDSRGGGGGGFSSDGDEYGGDHRASGGGYGGDGAGPPPDLDDEIPF